jgi:hypothetical protein
MIVIAAFSVNSESLHIISTARLVKAPPAHMRYNKYLVNLHDFITEPWFQSREA